MAGAARKEGGREERGSQLASEGPDLGSILYSVGGKSKKRVQRRAVPQRGELQGQKLVERGREGQSRYRLPILDLDFGGELQREGDCEG
jgi:hypothetical protein